MEDRTKGIISTISGFVWWFALGYIGTWGNIVPYVTSYFRLYDKSITFEITFLVLAAQVAVAGIIMYPATNISLKLGPRLAECVAGTIICGGIVISSYMTNFWVFFAIYGFTFSIGFAMTLSFTLIPPWSYIP